MARLAAPGAQGSGHNILQSTWCLLCVAGRVRASAASPASPLCAFLWLYPAGSVNVFGARSALVIGDCSWGCAATELDDGLEVGLRRPSHAAVPELAVSALGCDLCPASCGARRTALTWSASPAGRIRKRSRAPSVKCSLSGATPKAISRTIVLLTGILLSFSGGLRAALESSDWTPPSFLSPADHSQPDIVPGCLRV